MKKLLFAALVFASCTTTKPTQPPAEQPPQPQKAYIIYEIRSDGTPVVRPITKGDKVYKPKVGDTLYTGKMVVNLN